MDRIVIGEDSVEIEDQRANRHATPRLTQAQGTWGRPPRPLSAPTAYRRPREALMSATDVRRSGFRLWTDMIRSGWRFRRSMLSRKTIVPVTGGFGTGSFAGGRLNMSAYTRIFSFGR